MLVASCIQEPLLAVGQVLCRVVRTVGDSDEFQQRHRLAAEYCLLGDGRTGLEQLREESASKLQMKSDHDVVDDCNLTEQADALKRARNPVAGHVVRPLRRQRLAAEGDSAHSRPIYAGHQVDEGAP
jgi:hypothetical protein